MMSSGDELSGVRQVSRALFGAACTVCLGEWELRTSLSCDKLAIRILWSLDARRALCCDSNRLERAHELSNTDAPLTSATREPQVSYGRASLVEGFASNERAVHLDVRSMFFSSALLFHCLSSFSVSCVRRESPDVARAYRPHCSATQFPS